MFRYVVRAAILLLLFALLGVGGLILALPAAAQEATPVVAPIVTPVPVTIEGTPPVVVEQTLFDWRSVGITATVIVLGFLVSQFGAYVFKSVPPEMMQLILPSLTEAVRVLQDFARLTPNKIDDAAAGEIIARLEALEKQSLQSASAASTVRAGPFMDDGKPGIDA